MSDFKRILTSVFIALLAFGVATTFAQEEDKATYEIYIRIIDLNLRENTAVAEITVNVFVPQGSNFEYIPLPVILSPNGKFIIEENNSKSTILYGDLTPFNRITIIQIGPRSAYSEFRFILTETFLPMGDTTLSQSNKKIVYLVETAYQELPQHFDNASIPSLEKIIIDSIGVEFSEPDGRRESNNSYSIEFASGRSADDMIFYIVEQKNPSWGIFFPLLLGLPLGFLGGIQLINTRVWARRTAFGAVVLLAILLVVLLFFFDSLRAYFDNDILLATGSLIGALFGLLTASINYLRTQQATP